MDEGEQKRRNRTNGYKRIVEVIKMNDENSTQGRYFYDFEWNVLSFKIRLHSIPICPSSNMVVIWNCF